MTTDPRPPQTDPGAERGGFARYQHSGKLGNALILVPVCALIIAPVIGYLVGAFSLHIPLMKLRIAAWCIAGALQGAAIGWVAYRAKCRSPFFATLAGLLSGVLGLYVAMVAFVAAVMNSGGTPVTFSTLIFDPPAAWQMLDFISTSGIFTRNGRPMSSGALWIDWAFESSAFLILSVVVSYFFIAGKVFCEACGCWLRMEKGNIRVALPGDPAVLASMKAGELDALSGLQRIVPAPHVRLDHVICPHCGNAGAYRFKTITPASWKDKEDNLSPLMQLTPASAQKLGALLAEEESRGKKLPGAQAAQTGNAQES